MGRSKKQHKFTYPRKTNMTKSTYSHRGGKLNVARTALPESAVSPTDYMAEYEHLPEDIQHLVRIHTFKRPHGSTAVDQFVDQYIACDPRSYTVRSKSGEDLAIVIATSDTSRTMFSAHVDTVHRTSGRQHVSYDHEMGIMLKTQNAGMSDNECLGADDGAGIWVLLQMIKANVPGTYVFHYGEEVGGIGSSGIAAECSNWLAGFDRAIAIDRKGTDNVITHQGWGRCCSDTFAKALAEQLNMAGHGHGYKPDNGGVFTDTANYADDIPECTNLSCGYDAQHTSHENLDVEFLIRLKDALIEVDWESLPTERKPGEVDSLYSEYSGGRYDLYKRSTTYYDDMAWDYGNDAAKTKPWEATKEKEEPPVDLEVLLKMTIKQIRSFVVNSSITDVADMLTAAADRIAELEDTVWVLEDELAKTEEVPTTFVDEEDDDYPKGVGKW
jgi:hypothetical protein